MKILGLIPARGGSKGIPNKNKKLLNGKPLLQYTIEAAKAARYLDRVIFSSEDKSLNELAKKLGVEVPFIRPGHLSLDTTGTLEVIQHAIDTLTRAGDEYDAVCLLQVTSPLRTNKFIDEAIQRFIKYQPDSLLSVLPVPPEYNPHWVYEKNKLGYLQIATGEKQIIKRRQDLPRAYHRDGAIYITRTKVLMQENSMYGSTIQFIESDVNRHVNIDTMKDWKRAEDMVLNLGY